MMEDIINNSKSMELINKIYQFKKDNNFEEDTVSLIITFCEEHDLKIEEVGEILAEDIHFKSMLDKTLKRENYIRTKKTDNDVIQLESDEW